MWYIPKNEHNFVTGTISMDLENMLSAINQMQKEGQILKDSAYMSYLE